MSRTTLVLNAKEDDRLQQDMLHTGLDKSTLIRAALDLYHMIRVKHKAGFEFAFVRDGTYVPVLIVGGGLFEQGEMIELQESEDPPACDAQCGAPTPEGADA